MFEKHPSCCFVIILMFFDLKQQLNHKKKKIDNVLLGPVYVGFLEVHDMLAEEVAQSQTAGFRQLFT